MKNIRFYEAEKYNSDDYEKVEDMIYKTIDKKSYGALKSFVNYCTNTIRYYKDEKSTVLLKQVISEVNKFLEDNYYFLA